MPQEVMSEYRAKKMEEEYFSRSTFPQACELVLKHGKSRDIYWGKPEVLAESRHDIDGMRMSMSTVMWKTKRDKPATITLLLPDRMSFKNLMVPCKYMETDRGYKNVNAIIIGGLALMNVVSFWMLFTMAEIGAEAFSSPIFLMAVSGLISAMLVAWRFNQTHFTHRLSVECFEPEKELGMTHLCYGVDCDVPVHRQLAWANVHPDLLREAIEGHQKVLNEHLLDMRGAIGEKNMQLDDMLRDRRNEAILQMNRTTVVNARPDIWSNPVVLGVVVVCVVLAGALVWLVSGG